MPCPSRIKWIRKQSRFAGPYPCPGRHLSIPQYFKKTVCLESSSSLFVSRKNAKALSISPKLFLSINTSSKTKESFRTEPDGTADALVTVQALSKACTGSLPFKAETARCKWFHGLNSMRIIIFRTSLCEWMNISDICFYDNS